MRQLFWEYDGHQFPFDFDDWDVAQRYKTAVNTLAATKVPERVRDPAGYIKDYCTAISVFFDTIFGKGTAEQLFGDNINKRLCDEAYQSLLECVANQVQESDARMLKAIRKYAPKKDVHS